MDDTPGAHGPAELADLWQIRENLYRYATAIDERDFDLLARVFTDDAEIDYAVEQGTRLSASEMIPWLRESLRMFARTHHVMTNPRIELASDAARSTTYLTSTHVQILHDGSESLVIQGGIYRDRHRRTPQGWRIAARRLESVWVQGRFRFDDEIRYFDAPHGA